MIGEVVATFSSTSLFTMSLSLGFDPSQYLSPSILIAKQIWDSNFMTNCVNWQFHEISVDALLHAREVINIITECCNRFFKLVTTL